MKDIFEKWFDLWFPFEIYSNSDNFLEKRLHLFSLFLEKKSWNTEISKMSFSEFKNLNFDENFVNLFSKIYFLKYKGNEIDASQIENIFQDLKDIFEKNL